MKKINWIWKDQPKDWTEHVTRHSPDALTIGSKFSHQAWENLDRLVVIHQESLIRKVQEALEQQLTTAQLLVSLPHAGKAGVVPISQLDDSPVVRVLRDPGGPYQQWVEVSVVREEERPILHEIILVAGQLTKTQIGMVTAYPSSAARPFPHTDMLQTNPEFYAECVGFWKHHRFVAEPTELLFSAQLMRSKGQEHGQVEWIQGADNIEMALSIFPGQPQRKTAMRRSGM